MTKLNQKTIFVCYIAVHCVLIWLGWITAIDYLIQVFQIPFNLGFIKAVGWLAAIMFVSFPYKRFKDGSYFQFVESGSPKREDSKIQA